MPLALAFLGDDVALYAVLKEMTSLHGRFHLCPLAEAEACIISARTLPIQKKAEAELAEVRATNSAMQTALVLHAGTREPDEADKEAAGIGNVFVRPVRVPHMLDALGGAVRLARLKAPRDLGGGFSFLPQEHAIRRGAVGVELSAREAGFLLAVLEAGPEGLSRERAMREVWGFHHEAESHAADTAAWRLRQKLQEAGLAEALVTESGHYAWRMEKG